MPNSGNNNQAQANIIAGQSQAQTAANLKAARDAGKRALTAAKMRDWFDSRDDHLGWFISYGGTADHANGPMST